MQISSTFRSLADATQQSNLLRALSLRTRVGSVNLKASSMCATSQSAKNG